MLYYWEYILLMSRKNKKEDTSSFLCGQRWIRTTEGVSQQIYSLPHLATLVFALIFGAKVILIFLMTKYNKSFLLQLLQIRYLYFLDYHQCALKLALEC